MEQIFVVNVGSFGSFPFTVDGKKLSANTIIGISNNKNLRDFQHGNDIIEQIQYNKNDR